MMDDQAIAELLRSDEPELDGALFTARVMNHVERRTQLRRWLPLAAGFVGLAIASEPLLQTIHWVTHGLAFTSSQLLTLMQ
jgi:hypothetical protein